MHFYIATVVDFSVVHHLSPNLRQEYENDRSKSFEARELPEIIKFIVICTLNFKRMNCLDFFSKITVLNERTLDLIFFVDHLSIGSQIQQFQNRMTSKESNVGMQLIDESRY